MTRAMLSFALGAIVLFLYFAAEVYILARPVA
jgi:hypothetical protein